MKIAVFYELERGGAKRSAEAFAEELAKYHSITLFVVADSFSSTKLSCRRYRVPSLLRNGDHGLRRVLSDTFGLVQLAFLHKKIAQTMQQEKFDLVLAHSSRFTQAPFLLFWSSIPVVYYCNETLRMVYDPLCAIPKSVQGVHRLYETLNRSIRKIIDTSLIQRASAILCNSRYTQKQIRRAYDQSATVMHLGVDAKLFAPAQEKRYYDALFVGSKSFLEGYELFLQAMKLLPWVRFRVISSDQQPLSDSQLARAYSQAKIVLALGRHEPFGLIPLEAMACGTPVVALDEGGYRESVLDRKTGILVKPNPSAIAHAVQYLLSHPAVLRSYGKAGVEHARLSWGWKKAGRRLHQFLQNIQGT